MTRVLYGEGVMGPVGWHVPPRDELFPVDDQQSCIICGDKDWKYVYLLLNTPQWVQALPWAINWFVVLCGPCNAYFQTRDDVALAIAYERSDRGTSSPDVAELLTAIRARSSEPPVPREDAQQA